MEILLRYGNHPGIVSLKHVHEVGGKVYLVLQLLRGGDLLDYMMTKVSFKNKVEKSVEKGTLPFRAGYQRQKPQPY